MNNKIAVILVLADVKYSLNDLEKHYKTFCGLYDSRADTVPVQYHRHAQSRVPVAEPGFHLARDTGNRRDPGQAR